MKQSSVISQLAELDSELISVLAQYTAIEEYERKYNEILKENAT